MVKRNNCSLLIAPLHFPYNFWHKKPKWPLAPHFPMCTAYVDVLLRPFKWQELFPILCSGLRIPTLAVQAKALLWCLWNIHHQATTRHNYLPVMQITGLFKFTQHPHVGAWASNENCNSYFTVQPNPKAWTSLLRTQPASKWILIISTTTYIIFCHLLTGMCPSMSEIILTG
jgi:hypothetical protein